MGSNCVVSFSLYGSLPLYTAGAIRNAELVHRIYPNWMARFYVDHTVPIDVVSALRDRGAQIITVNAESLGPMYGRHWRFWVASDPSVERFIVRDADSRLNWREKAAVDDWIQSGCSFHIMRDSIQHWRRVLGGMWGGVGGKIPDIRELTDQWGRYTQQGECDQFVSTVLFPRFEGDYICHDSIGHFPDGRLFPPHRHLEDTSFVGQVVHLEMEGMDTWRQLGVYENEIFVLHTQLNEKEAARRLLIEQLEMPDAPTDIRAALTVARVLRRIRSHVRSIPRRLSDR